MKELVGLKILVGLRANGHADHPNFNLISTEIRQGLDWSKYVDIHGMGCHYDKTSGHSYDTVDSPYGQQWLMLLVPEPFATEAIKLFPTKVTEMDEAEIENFYDNKAHAHEQDEIIDTKVLEDIKLKQSLGIELTPSQVKALDPDDPTPGIVKNTDKVWSTFKTGKVAISVVASKILEVAKI